MADLKFQLVVILLSNSCRDGWLGSG